ncbi:hypothetical protein B0H13DRAFT_2268987, partial [Mycena leptocephala]
MWTVDERKDERKKERKKSDYNDRLVLEAVMFTELSTNAGRIPACLYAVFPNGRMEGFLSNGMEWETSLSGVEFSSNFAEAELVEKQVVISASLSSEAPLYKPNALPEFLVYGVHAWQPQLKVEFPFVEVRRAPLITEEIWIKSGIERRSRIKLVIDSPKAAVLLVYELEVSFGLEACLQSSPAEPPLAPFKDEVLGALIPAVATLAATRAALAGLPGPVSTPHLLSHAELGFVVLKERDPQAPDATAPAHVRDQPLPLLLNAPPRDDVSARARYQHVLNALSTLCGPPPLFETLVEALTPRLVAIAFPSLSSPGAYLRALLAAMKRVLAGKVDEGHADVAGGAESRASATLDVTQTSAPASAEPTPPSGPSAGQRAPAFRIVPVGSVVNVNKGVDELAPFLE